MMRNISVCLRIASVGFFVCFIAQVALASKTTDRLYLFGDDPFEAGTHGDVVGVDVNGSDEPDEQSIDSDNNASGGTPFPSQGAANLTHNGEFTNSPGDGPRYALVDGTGSLPLRPGVVASSGELGATFDGTADYFFASNFNAIDGTNPVRDYNQTYDRGFQLWVHPDSGGAGALQNIVRDADQHGVQISASDTWVLQDSGGTFDSDVNVTFDAWSHVMHYTVDNVMARLYIDGVVVAASGGNYFFDDQQITIGRDMNDTVGDLGFFDGTVDDMEMFVTGSGLFDSFCFPTCGTFDAETDNDFIALFLSTAVDGDVDRNGSLGPEDEAAFVAGWLSVNVVDGFNVGGDLASYERGDLNLDGTVDLDDAILLNAAFVAAGSSFNFGLLSGGVPEPASCGLLLVGLVGVTLTGRRRRKT